MTKVKTQVSAPTAPVNGAVGAASVGFLWFLIGGPVGAALGAAVGYAAASRATRDAVSEEIDEMSQDHVDELVETWRKNRESDERNFSVEVGRSSSFIFPSMETKTYTFFEDD